MGTRAWAAATLVLLAADVGVAPAGVPVCGTVPDCLARMRDVANASGGITDEQNAVTKALQSLSPESILPVMELLHDRDGNVRELAGYVLRSMPGLGPEHLAPLERAVEAGDGWLPAHWLIEELGVRGDVVEDLLSHAPTRLERTYRGERRSSLADMRAALDLWSTKLVQLLSEPDRGTQGAEGAQPESAARS